MELMSHFDHVAIVVRSPSEPSEVFLLEAFGTRGVQVSRWSQKKQFLGCHFRKIAVRKLNWANKSSQIEKLKTMCSDIENLSLTNLFKGGSNSAHRYVSTQLACYAYSMCGIVTADEPTQATYTPHNFSAVENSIQLVEGASFAEEVFIVTDAMLEPPA